MAQLFSNNALTTIAAPFMAGDTQLLVKSGTGSLFPNIPLPVPNDLGITAPQENYFLLTIENATATNREVISIVGREGDVLYVGARGIEDTAPTDWDVNSIVELRLTAGTLNSQTSALNVINDTLQASNQLSQQEIMAIGTVNESVLSVRDATTGTGDAIVSKLTFQNGHLGAINSGIGILNGSAEEIKGILNQQLQKPDNSEILSEIDSSIDAVNSSVTISNQKLDSLITLFQQSANSGGSGTTTLNTEQLEAILQALIMMNQKPSPRLDTNNRMVIDASETLVSLNTTTALSVNSTNVGTTIGTTTVVFDPFSNPSVFYSNIKVT